MLKSQIVIYVCGIVTVALLTAYLLTCKTKLIFKTDKLKAQSRKNLIYDPDYAGNGSHLCLYEKDAYRIPFERSTCRNKSLLQWYNPWVRNGLWWRFRHDAETGRRSMKLKKDERAKKEKTKNEIVESPAPEGIKSREEKTEEEPSEVIYAFLVGFLLMSALATFWELFKDKMTKSRGGNAKAQDRECTLAEFTINRHLRRESQQQSACSHLQRQTSFEVTAKVTQNLIHQSSLDRAFSRPLDEVKSEESRRNSIPCSYVSSSDKGSGKNIFGILLNAPARLVKRESFDISREELHLDSRKKPRHFIRRH